MALLLDPRLALVWRTPTSLQIGIDYPVVTLQDVSTAIERMLSALTSGISASGLAMIGHSAGASDAEIETFLAQVTPALVPTGVAEAHASPVVAIEGRGRSVGQVWSLLADAGITVVNTDAENSPAETAAAILITHFVLSPHRSGGWLRRDIPHLPIIFGDTEVRIGPFVDPGHGPCLHCIDLHNRDADASWTAMASQLLGRIGATETVTVGWEVATLVARMVMARLAAREVAAHTVAAVPAPTVPALPDTKGMGHATRHLSVATGQITERRRRFHPECGCRSLQGNGTADDVATGSSRIRPMTAAMNVSRA